MSRIIYLLLITLVGCTSTKLDTEKRFQEKFRPQYHFSPPSKWMNDPNGMVFYKGEYHLFYQYHPHSTVWGPMHWGHATSKDLLHWDHLPIALYPDSVGMIFSGSAVVDWKNSSGFGSIENPPLIAIFTLHNEHLLKAGRDDFQSQGIAHSLDNGRTWEKYDQNPVLNNPGIKDFRDPKILWSEQHQRWVLTLAAQDRVHFYSSYNLKEWKFESEFGLEMGAHEGVWECPDLFPMKSSSGDDKWVLLVSMNPGGPQGGSATQYFIGDFTGSEFKPDDSKTRWLDMGADNYASVSWSDVPETDGRRLIIGWMSNWQYATVVPTQEWRSAMTIPRELTLDNETLKSFPVEEFESLARKPLQGGTQIKIPSNTLDLNFSSINKDLEFRFSNEEGEELLVSVSGNEVIIDRSKAGISDFNPQFAAAHKGAALSKISSIRVLLDHSSIEVFANGGELVMTDLVFPTGPYTDLSIQGESVFEGYEVSGIWNEQ